MGFASSLTLAGLWTPLPASASSSAEPKRTNMGHRSADGAAGPGVVRGGRGRGAELTSGKCVSVL